MALKPECGCGAPVIHNLCGERIDHLLFAADELATTPVNAEVGGENCGATLGFGLSPRGKRMAYAVRHSFVPPIVKEVFEAKCT